MVKAKQQKTGKQKLLERLPKMLWRFALILPLGYALALLGLGLTPTAWQGQKELLQTELGAFTLAKDVAPITVFVEQDGLNLSVIIPAKKIVCTKAGNFVVSWQEIFQLAPKAKGMQVMPSVYSFPPLPLKDMRFDAVLKQADLASRDFLAPELKKEPPVHLDSAFANATELVDRALQSQSWYELRWGNQGFIQNKGWVNSSVLSVFDLLTGSPAVLSVQERQGHLTKEKNRWQLQLSQDEYLALHDFIQSYIVRDSQGFVQFAKIPSDISEAALLQAKGSFSVMNTSNTWVVSALQKTGQPAPSWTSLAYFASLYLPR